MFICKECSEQKDNFKNIVNHHIESHPFNEIQIVEEILCESTGKFTSRLLSFNLTPSVIEGTHEIVPTDLTILLQPLRQNNQSKQNCHKKSAQSADIHFKNTAVTNTTSSGVEHDHEKEGMANLLGSATGTLKKYNCLKEFMDFLHLLKNDLFPMNNIAFQLFLDVVRFLSLKTSSEMRYSPDVKLFWKTGLQLFHGKFLMCVTCHMILVLLFEQIFLMTNGAFMLKTLLVFHSQMSPQALHCFI
jgi:hypothetical protein